MHIDLTSVAKRSTVKTKVQSYTGNYGESDNIKKNKKGKLSVHIALRYSSLHLLKNVEFFQLRSWFNSPERILAIKSILFQFLKKQKKSPFLTSGNLRELRANFTFAKKIQTRLNFYS